MPLIFIQIYSALWLSVSGFCLSIIVIRCRSVSEMSTFNVIFAYVVISTSQTTNFQLVFLFFLNTNMCHVWTLRSNSQAHTVRETETHTWLYVIFCAADEIVLHNFRITLFRTRGSPIDFISILICHKWIFKIDRFFISFVQKSRKSARFIRSHFALLASPCSQIYDVCYKLLDFNWCCHVSTEIPKHWTTVLEWEIPSFDWFRWSIVFIITFIFSFCAAEFESQSTSEMNKFVSQYSWVTLYWRFSWHSNNVQ